MSERRRGQLSRWARVTCSDHASDSTKTFCFFFQVFCGFKSEMLLGSRCSQNGGAADHSHGVSASGQRTPRWWRLRREQSRLQRILAGPRQRSDILWREPSRRSCRTSSASAGTSSWACRRALAPPAARSARGGRPGAPSARPGSPGAARAPRSPPPRPRSPDAPG